MTRVFLIGTLAVLVAQIPLLFREHAVVGPLYIVPILAVCLFLLAIALAARGTTAPPWTLGAGVWVVVAFSVFTYPGPALGATPEFLLFLGGVISLLVVGAWIVRGFGDTSKPAASLLAAAVLGGVFLLAHAGARRTASYLEPEADRMASMTWWAYYITCVLGTSALLAVCGTALVLQSRRRRTG